MKKFLMLFCALLCIFLFSCYHSDKNISISYTDNEDSYSMNAWFSKNKTRDAELFMDEKIGRQNNMSFINTRTDATFTLDDGSKFYLKKSPGHIEIKLNKDENSSHFYQVIRSMCKGLKNVVMK